MQDEEKPADREEKGETKVAYDSTFMPTGIHVTPFGMLVYYECCSKRLIVLLQGKLAVAIEFLNVDTNFTLGCHIVWGLFLPLGFYLFFTFLCSQYTGLLFLFIWKWYHPGGQNEVLPLHCWMFVEGFKTTAFMKLGA